jgi:hypothetical protein
MDIQAKRQALAVAQRGGDHLSARALASELLADPASPPEVHAEAQRVLRETSTDSFIFVAAALGLGVLAWLVYKYSS